MPLTDWPTGIVFWRLGSAPHEFYEKLTRDFLNDILDGVIAEMTGFEHFAVEKSPSGSVHNLDISYRVLLKGEPLAYLFGAVVPADRNMMCLKPFCWNECLENLPNDGFGGVVGIDEMDKVAFT